MQPTDGYGAATSPTERNWALVAHAGCFVAAYVLLGIVAPLLVLLLKGNESAFVRRHAIESINFQLNMLVWLGVSALLLFVLIGFVLLPLAALWYLIHVIRGSLAARDGREFRYPLILRLAQ